MMQRANSKMVPNPVNSPVNSADADPVANAGTGTQPGNPWAGKRRLSRAALPTVLAALVIAVAGGVTVDQAHAQAPAAKQQGKSSARAKSGGDAGGSNEARLQRRVEQLEEQLVDMQVVIGTLESLAKSGGGGGAAPIRSGSAPAGGAYSSSDAARIDTMEMQIRALSAQIEQMSNQLRTLDGRRSDAAPAGQVPGAGTSTFAGRAPSAPPAAPPRFGSTTVSPVGGDAIGSLIANNAQVPPAGPVVRDPLPPAIAGGDGATAKQLYETAYGYLLQQDYGAAEAAFSDFLQRYPNDQLASNAQYWLGESYFVRGQYKEAASAFLKGVQTYGRGTKAPDSMLKLAMSLDRLGQREAACSSYAELSNRFPNAPSHVRSRASSERQRIRCG